MKIVFYSRYIIMGGIEKALDAILDYIYEDYEVEIVYTDESILDMRIVEMLQDRCKVYKVDKDSGIIECDICVWCSLYFDYDMLKNVIKAKKYYTWIHSMPRVLNKCLLDNENFVNDTEKFICVSEAVKNNLNIKKEGIVIHNFAEKDIKKLSGEPNPFESKEDNNILKLATVCRLSSGKGFERLKKFTDELREKQIKYELIIVGNGRDYEKTVRELFEKDNQAKMAGFQINPYPYIKNADYLVHLSDDESWCLSITEAKILGVPCIVTNFESSKEQIIDDKNGIIVSLKDKTYYKYFDRIIGSKEKYKQELKQFEYVNEIAEWKEILR